MIQIDITPSFIEKLLGRFITPELVRPALPAWLRETRLFFLRAPTVEVDGPNEDTLFAAHLTFAGGVRSLSSPWIVFQLSIVVDVEFLFALPDGAFRIVRVQVDPNNSTIELVPEPGSSAHATGQLSFASVSTLLDQPMPTRRVADRFPLIDQLRVLRRLEELLDAVDANPGLGQFTGATAAARAQLNMLPDLPPILGETLIYDGWNQTGPLAEAVTAIEAQIPSLASLFPSMAADMLAEGMLAGFEWAAFWPQWRRDQVVSLMSNALSLEVDELTLHPVTPGAGGTEADLNTAGLRAVPFHVAPKRKDYETNTELDAGPPPTFKQGMNNVVLDQSCNEERDTYYVADSAPDVEMTPCLQVSASLRGGMAPPTGNRDAAWGEILVAHANAIEGYVENTSLNRTTQQQGLLAEFYADRWLAFRDMVLAPDPPSWLGAVPPIGARLPLGYDLGAWVRAEPLLFPSINGPVTASLVQYRPDKKLLKWIYKFIDFEFTSAELLPIVRVPNTDALAASVRVFSSAGSADVTLSLQAAWQWSSWSMPTSAAYWQPAGTSCVARLGPISIDTHLDVNQINVFKKSGWIAGALALAGAPVLGAAAWRLLQPRQFEDVSLPLGAGFAPVDTLFQEFTFEVGDEEDDDADDDDGAVDDNDTVTITLSPRLLLPAEGNLIGLCLQLELGEEEDDGEEDNGEGNDEEEPTSDGDLDDAEAALPVFGREDDPFEVMITFTDVQYEPLVPEQTPGWPHGIDNAFSSVAMAKNAPTVTVAEFQAITAATLRLRLEQNYGLIDPPFNTVAVAPFVNWSGIVLRRGANALPTNAAISMGYAQASEVSWNERINTGPPQVWNPDGAIDAGINSLSDTPLPVEAFGAPVVTDAIASFASALSSVPMADVYGANVEMNSAKKAMASTETDAAVTVQWAYHSTARMWLETEFNDLLNMVVVFPPRAPGTDPTEFDVWPVLEALVSIEAARVEAGFAAAIESAPEGIGASLRRTSELSLELLRFVVSKHP